MRSTFIATGRTTINLRTICMTQKSMNRYLLIQHTPWNRELPSVEAYRKLFWSLKINQMTSIPSMVRFIKLYAHYTILRPQFVCLWRVTCVCDAMRCSRWFCLFGFFVREGWMTDVIGTFYFSLNSLCLCGWHTHKQTHTRTIIEDVFIICSRAFVYRCLFVCVLTRGGHGNDEIAPRF